MNIGLKMKKVCHKKSVTKRVKPLKLGSSLVPVKSSKQVSKDKMVLVEIYSK